MEASTSRNATVLVAVVALGAAFYWLRGILAPFTLAVFLLFVIDGLARAVRRHAAFIPEGASVPAAIVLTLIAFVGAVWVVVDGAAGFASQLGGLRARLDGLLAEGAALLNLDIPPTVDELLVRLDPAQYAGRVASALQGIASDTFFVLIYLGFLLASRHGFKRKIVALFPGRDERREAQHILERIRDGVESYVWVQTVTGVMIAASAWVVMAAVGLDNAPFWAFVIFLSSYVPIIGGAIAGVAPPVFALIQFDTWWQAVALFGAIQIVMFVVGNIILPRMQADSMNVDPVVVLLSLAFWGALWGVTGAFLSTPLTVMAMAILAEFRASRWVAVVLSGDGKPYPMDDTTPEPPRASPKPAAAPKKRARPAPKGG